MTIINMPDNAVPNYRCSQCGASFSFQDASNTCPFCGYRCTPDTCRVADVSDEGY